MTVPILAAYDPFTEDAAPLDLGVALHELTGAPLIVATVCPGREIVAGVAETRSRALAELAETRLAAVRLAVPFEPRLLYDFSVPRALNDAAADTGAALIVLGSTNRSVAGRVLPGSTAERLLHGAPCAVALAPKDFRRRKPETIAVAFADTPEGHRALRAAHALAARAGAMLRVVSVLHPSVGLGGGFAQVAPPPRGVDLKSHERAAHESALHHALLALGTGVEVETELHVGDPADVLIPISEQVDALVCGSRGYGPLRSVLLGGVSRRLVDGARCPLLVLPRGVEDPLGGLLDAAVAS